jgi:hypothetical protein
MFTLAEYERWKAERQENGVGAAQVVIGSVNEKPDDLAGDLMLANEFGKATGNPVPPLPLVKEYRNVFQEAVEREKNKTILSGAPVLTEWLRDPENATLARDDLTGLSWWETAFLSPSISGWRMRLRSAPMTRTGRSGISWAMKWRSAILPAKWQAQPICPVPMISFGPARGS